MNDDIKKYDEIKQAKYVKDRYPIPYYPNIKDSEYEDGFIWRYFARRSNDPDSPIIEITKKQYDSHGNRESGLDWALYSTIKLKWKISGLKEDLKNTNGLVIEKSISHANYDTVKLKDKKMAGLVDRLTNVMQFAKPRNK